MVLHCTDESSEEFTYVRIHMPATSFFGVDDDKHSRGMSCELSTLKMRLKNRKYSEVCMNALKTYEQTYLTKI